MRKTNVLGSIFTSFVLVVIISLVFLMFKNKNSSEHVFLGESSRNEFKNKTIREKAESPVFYSNRKQDEKASAQVENRFAIPDTLPPECRSGNVARTIAENSFDEFKAVLSQEDVKNCVFKLGLDIACLRDAEPSMELETFCDNRVLVIRAKVIDLLTANLNIDEMDESVLSNKVISSLFSENVNEKIVFEMADKLVEINYRNIEAHNIRSFYGFQKIVEKWDKDTEDKVAESSDVLMQSERQDDLKRALVSAFSLKLLKFYRERDLVFLSEAEQIALNYMERYSNEPDGYYLLMQIYGFKNDRENILKWLDKGLSFGSNQTYYTTYQAVRKEVENGQINIEHLGLRLDPEKQFSAQELLKSQ